MQLHMRGCSVFAAACAAVLFTAVPARSAVIFQVTVNTVLIDTTPGNINLQFNPGIGSQPATATITGFSSVGGTLSGVPATQGGASGALPGTVTIDNSGGLNDYFHAFTFGQSFQFLLTISGPAIDSPNGTATSGSSFGLALYNAAGDAAFLTTERDGFAGIAEVNLDGSVTPLNFPPSVLGGVPVVTFTPIDADIPEPSTVVSLLSGALLLAGLGVLRRR